MEEETKDVYGPEDEEEEVVEEVEVDDGLENLKAFFADEVDEDEEAEEAETEEEVEEPEVEEPQGEEQPVDPLEEKKFSQRDLDRIIGQSRIQGREIADTVRLLEQETGMPLNQIWEHVKNRRVEEYENEYGMPREEAQRIVEATQKVPYLERNLQELWQQQHLTQQQQQFANAYQHEKAEFITKPEVKRYEADIDAVISDSVRRGAPIGWTAAMNYVLGQKVLSGELTQSIRESTQQKTLHDVGKRPRTPESSGAGGQPSRSIPKELQMLAKSMGVDPRDAAKNYWQEQKQEQKRR